MEHNYDMFESEFGVYVSVLANEFYVSPSPATLLRNITTRALLAWKHYVALSNVRVISWHNMTNILIRYSSYTMTR